MPIDLKDKVIIVTGGTSGIGEACSRHFAQLGAKVAMASNQKEAGQALAQELTKAGHTVRFTELDVTREADLERFVAETVSEWGGIDAVHCNAGVWGKGKVTEFNDAIWEKVMGVNVKGAFLLTKHTIPAMEKRGQGVFLVTTSVASQVGFPEHALYCASKAALEALVRCLATDHAGKVRAVAISPGTIDTPMLAATCQGWDKPVAELYAEVEKRIPVRRLGQPLDVARAAAFLLSDEAAYVNAATLVLDGGTLALPPW